MKLRGASLALGICVLAVGPASATIRAKTRITCPSSAAVGTNLTMDVHLENSECSSATVRLITTIAGNTGDPMGGSVGGIGVFGPKVADEVIVPAGSCTFPPGPPGTLDLVLDGPLTIPEATEGTVEVHALISEWDFGTFGVTRVDHCLVEVPDAP